MFNHYRARKFFSATKDGATVSAADVQPKPQDETQEDTQDDSNEGEVHIPASQHNAQIKRLKEQIESNKSDLEALRAAAAEKDASLETLKAQIEKVTQEQQEKDAKAEQEIKRLAIEGVLAKAGCIDTKGALAHIDLAQVSYTQGKLEGLNVSDLKKEKAHLFKSSASVKTSAPKADGELTDFEKVLAQVFN